MSVVAIVFVVIALLSAALGYVLFVAKKKRIELKDIRVRSLQDAKKLLTLPYGDSPLKYLEKLA